MKIYLTVAVTMFTMLVGVLLTFWGLWHLQWPQVLPWTGREALYRFLGTLIVLMCTVFFVSQWSRKNVLLVGVSVAVGIAIMAGAVWPLLVALWFAVGSTLLGRSIFEALRIKFDEDRWLTDFLLGAGAYGTAVGLLAHFNLNYPGVFGVALAFPVLLYWRVMANQANTLWGQMVQHSRDGFCVNKLDVAIVVVALLYFIVALMPELGFDSLAMHLFISSHLAQRHQWGFDASTYVWAVMPMLGDWLFSIGYMLAGETAARLINVGFIFVLGWLVRDLVLWAGGTIVGARWAALIFLSTPLTFMEGSTLFIESIWASFVVAGTLAVLRASTASGNQKFELPVAGLLLGCALAAKAVTFTILPVLVLILVWRYRSWYKAIGLPKLALGLCLFLVIGLIPYVTAWRLTGNPVFPLFNKIFQSPYYLTNENFSNPLFESGFSWDVFYSFTFESWKYLESTSGAAGFQWLLLLLPATAAMLLNRAWKGVVLLFVGVLSIALVFHSTSYLRYVFPAWAILAAFIGVALDNIFSRSALVKNLGWMVAVVAVGLNLLFFSSSAFYRDFAINSAFADESSRELYLSGRLPIRNAVELINRLNTGRTPVAVFGNPLAAGLSGDALYPNWYNVAFQGEIASIHTEQDIADILMKRGVNFIILDANWNGVNCCGEGKEKQVLIERVSEKIAEYGTLSVRKLKNDYRYKTELLSNPDFKSIQGWGLAPGAKYDADTGVMLVTVSSSAVQGAAVSPGGRYLNVVVARCAKETTLGRVQINWLDVKGQFVNVDIKTFECAADWTEHSMEVTAPPNAATAVVYVTGHTSIPIEFKSNSLRQ